MTNLSGRRMKTLVPDSNDVERGTVDIPIGWCAEIGDLSEDGHYAINWDRTPEGLDMGWCLWTAEEIRRDAELLTVNRIVEVKLTLADNGEDWFVDVTKEFAPENGGGSERLREYGGRNLHRALDVAREMVTVSPARRSEVSNG